MSTQKARKILDEVRDVMRLHHYSIHTERTYCEWIKKYVTFHDMNLDDDLKDSEKKIEAFLTHLAVKQVLFTCSLFFPLCPSHKYIL